MAADIYLFLKFARSETEIFGAPPTVQEDTNWDAEGGK